jgi:hypothetical protein
MGGAASGLDVPRTECEAGFDFVVASEPALARGCGVRKVSRLPSALPAESVPSTRGRGTDRRYTLGSPPDGLHGASEQDVQIAISDMLSSHALDPATCAGSGSPFICVAIDRRSPQGVRVLEGGNMSCIPEDLPLAWCARESLRSERECWMESVKIVHLLAPMETPASGPRRRLGGAPLPFHEKEMKPRRGAPDTKKKCVVRRVVPVGPVADDSRVDGGQSWAYPTVLGRIGGAASSGARWQHLGKRPPSGSPRRKSWRQS